jgi:hypothetical protein
MSTNAPTPNRRTVARFNIPQPLAIRKPWQFRRTAHELAGGGIRAGVGTATADSPATLAPVSSGVHFLPGGGWALSATATDYLFEDLNDAIIKSPDVDLAPGMQTVKLFRDLSDLVNVGMAAGAVVSGGEAFLKGVAAGLGWDVAVLAADGAAYLAPNLLGMLLPLDRVAAGKVNYDPNTGFALLFAPPGSFWGSQAFLRFYFGGPADVTPREATGGEFCVTFFGDGDALLQERDASTPDDPQWQDRMRFPWTSSDRAPDTLHTLYLRPYGYDRIAFETRATGKTGGSTVYGPHIPLGILQPGSRGHSVYQDKPEDTGHEHTLTITGSGAFRVDIARNYRAPWGIARLKHATSGVLVDDPFSIPNNLPAGTPLKLTTDAFLLPDTAVSVEILDGSTFLPLSLDGDGNFLTNAQTTYLARFTFATVNQFVSPVLFGYTIEVAPLFLTTTPTPVTTVRSGLPGPKVRGWSATGPDLVPGHETAGLMISDLGDDLAARLRTQDRIPADLLVTNAATGAIVSRVFSGITVDAPATFRGKPGSTYPNWRDYEQIRELGPWALLAEQVPFGYHDFRDDHSATPDANGNQKTQPWTVPNIIRFALNACGYGNDQIFIPAYYETVRLWDTGNALSVDTYLVQPGGTNTYTRLLESLCHDFLGAALCWCPNSGPLGPDGVALGAWRVLPNPQPPYASPLASFVTSRPGGSAHKSGTHPGTYGAGVTFIEEKTLKPYVRSPEVNRVYVCGVVGGETGEPKAKVEAELLNYVSYDWAYPTITADPNHPDYLFGRAVPVEIYDAGLYGQQAVDTYCRRVFDLSAHAQKWCRWVAPLLFVSPAEDGLVYSRPLRVNDVVLVGGFTAVLRSADPEVHSHDLTQRATYTALFV